MAATTSSSTASATAGPAATPAPTIQQTATQTKSVKMSTDSYSFHPPRTLVLCFDGTSNQYDGDVSTARPTHFSAHTHSTRPQNTNVVKFYSLLKKDITEQQLCYYQASASRLPTRLTRLTDLFFSLASGHTFNRALYPPSSHGALKSWTKL